MRARTTRRVHLPGRADRRLLRTRRPGAPALDGLPRRRRGVAPHRRVLRRTARRRRSSRSALTCPSSNSPAPARIRISLGRGADDHAAAAHHRDVRRAGARARAALARCASSHCAGATTTARPRRCATCSASGRGGATPSSRCSSRSSTRSCRASPVRPTSIVALPCSYDFDVAANKYLYALDDGEIPLLMLFSGTVFTRGANGFSVAADPVGPRDPLPAARRRCGSRRWSCTSPARPGCGWARDTFDALASLPHEQRTAELGRSDRAAAEGGR